MDELASRRGAFCTRLGVVVLFGGLSLLPACADRAPTAPNPITHPQPPPPPPVTPAGPAVLVGAGDIAVCGPDLATAELTARLLDGIDGTVFTAGDNTQHLGTAQEFRDCYGPTWGRHRARTRPSPGNHDYGTPNAAPYFDYFGAAAGSPGEGYYSYELGGWHVVALNSNLSMERGSAQASWLRRDLEANTSLCTAAYWHHPLRSSATNGGTGAVRHAWELLHEFGAEIVMNGHDHLFERFAPQDPGGRHDPHRGIRQFTVGTGGYPLYPIAKIQPNSEVRGHSHGVLRLTLRPDGYDWTFVPVPGGQFSDSGSGACH